MEKIYVVAKNQHLWIINGLLEDHWKRRDRSLWRKSFYVVAKS